MVSVAAVSRRRHVQLHYVLSRDVDCDLDHRMHCLRWHHSLGLLRIPGKVNLTNRWPIPKNLLLMSKREDGSGRARARTITLHLTSRTRVFEVYHGALLLL